MGGAAGGALGGLGAVGGAPAAVPAPGMDMGGWQMPGITGGTKSLYAAPGATGAMAPPQQNWLQRNPQARDALLKFGQSLLEQRTPGPGGPGGPGLGISRGQWQPPMGGMMGGGLPQSSSLPQSSTLAGPDTGAYGGAIGGMQQYAGYGGPAGDPNAAQYQAAAANWQPPAPGGAPVGMMPGAQQLQNNPQLRQQVMARFGGGGFGGMMGGGMGGRPFWGGR